MNIKIRQSILIILFGTSTMALIGCGHNNPILAENIISNLKEDFMFESSEYPIKECANYYASSNPDASWKSKCDSWTQSYYKSLMNDGAIPSTTTINDLRDPIFWKRMSPIK